MKKNFVLFAVFVVCLVTACESAFASWWFADVFKTDTSNVYTDAIIDIDTGIDIYVSSYSGTVKTDVYFREYPGDPYVVIPGTTLSVSADESDEKFINHTEGNYYKLKLRWWGLGYGSIQVHQ